MYKVSLLPEVVNLTKIVLSSVTSEYLLEHVNSFRAKVSMAMAALFYDSMLRRDLRLLHLHLANILFGYLFG